MKVDVSGNTIHMPPFCACCGGMDQMTLLPIAFTKSTGSQVVHTRTTAWDIPYCTACARHIGAMDRARSITQGGTIATIVCAVAALFLAWWLAVIVLVGGAVIVAVLNSRLIEEAKSLCGKGCAGVDRSVLYLYWHGTHHSFEMTAQGFALAFMRANLRKLINVDGPTAQWLAQNGVTLSPPGQQAPRKYRT